MEYQSWSAIPPKMMISIDLQKIELDNLRQNTLITEVLFIQLDSQTRKRSWIQGIKDIYLQWIQLYTDCPQPMDYENHSH